MARRSRTTNISFDGEWVWVEEAGCPWVVGFLPYIVDGIPQTVGLRLEPREGVTLGEWVLTSERLRSLPFARLRDAALAFVFEDLHTAARTLGAVKRGPNGRWPDEHYRRVAAVYRSAGRSPRKEIARRWHISDEGASKWIRAARDRGFLGEAPRPGVAGSVEEGG